MSAIAADVVALLTQYFGHGSVCNANEKAHRLANQMKEILLDAEYVDGTTTEHIEMDDDPSDPDYVQYESTDEDEETEPDAKKIKFSDSWVPKESVEEAINWYRTSSNKGSRPLTSMKVRYRWIRNEHHMTKLRDIERRGIEFANRVAALNDLKKELIAWVLDRFSKGVTLHDDNLRGQAMRIASGKGSLPTFKCSNSWLQKFKRDNRLCSRRITKFVSRKTFQDLDKIRDNSKKFVEEIKELIKTHKLPLTAVYNADQSGFVKELHGARTLAICGQKKVFRLVDSVSATTHSFTVMPLIGAGGNVCEKLYIVLQEPGGQGPRIPHFAPDNLVVDFHSTHIMSKKLMESWVQRCVVPYMPKRMLLIVDSWSSFKDHQAFLRHVPKGKTLLIRNIPPGATGLVQPCDVGLFLYMKRFVKKITLYVLVHDIPFRVSQRNNILKMISQVWRVFSHPRFANLFAYAFHKAGFRDRPPPFDNPVDISFPKCMHPCCQNPGCSQFSFIFCVYCDQYLCFNHYLIEFHKC